MPIPPLELSGLLPPGVHDCTIEEIRSAFVEHQSQRRSGLFAGMQRFLTLIKQIGCFEAAYIDGSFVTDKPEPFDVDVVLELPPPSPAHVILLQINRVFDSEFVFREFGVHVWAYVRGLPQNDFRAFFQYVRVEEAGARGLPPETRKGILKLEL